jgi:hypothetical protein
MGSRYQKSSEEIVATKVQQLGQVAQGVRGTVLASEVSIGTYSSQDLQFYKDVTSSILDELHTKKETQVNQTSSSNNIYEKKGDINNLGTLFDSSRVGDGGAQVSRMQQIFAHSEKEQIDYNIEGVVKTSDGAEISIDIKLGLSRELVTQGKITEVFVDPLVINYDAPSVALSHKQFSFDIDSDGERDQISLLRKGSGYLALDKNEDGTINNGKELFGASNGDGFAELALYDDDKNGWIDENDIIFNKLRIWVKDDDNNDTLLGLGQVGIGAILLSKTETAFDLMDEKGGVAGQLTHSSIFLKENGDVGLVQNMKHAVYSKDKETSKEVLEEQTLNEPTPIAQDIRADTNRAPLTLQANSDSKTADSLDDSKDRLEQIRKKYATKIHSIDIEINQLRGKLVNQNDEKQRANIEHEVDSLTLEKRVQEMRMIVELNRLYEQQL